MKDEGDDDGRCVMMAGGEYVGEYVGDGYDDDESVGDNGKR